MTSALDVWQVREVARSAGLKEAYYNRTSRVISFARPYEIVDRIRFNVYYTTGTVGTCLNHPTQGRTQLFRRNVNLSMLREIFENPRKHTGLGYHRKSNDTKNKTTDNGKTNIGPFRRTRLFRGSQVPIFNIGERAYCKGFTNCTILSDPDPFFDHRVKIRYDDGSTYHVEPDQLEEIMEEVLDEEEAAKNQKKSIEEELNHLEKYLHELKDQDDEITSLLEALAQARREREEYERRQADLEAKRLEEERQLQLQLHREEEQRKAEEVKRKAEEEKRQEKEEKRKAAAQELKQEQEAIRAKRLARGKHLLVHCVQDSQVIQNFRDTVTCVSCGDLSSVIMLQENGAWSSTPGIPKQLFNKLNGRQKLLPKPDYVSIGTLDRYYVRFADGKSEWVGCEEMTKELQTTK